MILLALLAEAARPTEGGSYSFDDDDVVTFTDGPTGAARVFYSTSGPNQTLLDDADGDGIPDFPALVAASTEAALGTFASAGFRPIPADEGEGGSDAMDVYLVDFGGNADGHYSTESCKGQVCGGYFVMENDFSGYGYSDLDSAVSTLTSHELFHGIQAAYDAGEESWYAEGTAVWAQQLFEPGNEDFVRFCSAYLEDTGRSLDNPPAGPVPEFAYATAIWWWFLTNRYGDDWMVDYLESTAEGDDLVALMAERVSLSTDWLDFSIWNLATGSYAGLVESYPFASELKGLKFEDRGGAIDDDQRFYPLSTTYYRFDHEGGELMFALAEDAPDLVFQLWSTDAEERMAELVAEPASTAGAVSLGEQPAGLYLFFGSNPTLAEDSTKVRMCLGPEAAACAPEPTDTGSPTDTAGNDDSGGGNDSGNPDEPEGCGCASAGPEAGALSAAAALWGLRRRRSGGSAR